VGWSFVFPLASVVSEPAPTYGLAGFFSLSLPRPPSSFWYVVPRPPALAFLIDSCRCGRQSYESGTHSYFRVYSKEQDIRSWNMKRWPIWAFQSLKLSKPSFALAA